MGQDISERKNPWFKPWFNIFCTHNQLCVPQCLKYLVYITLKEFPNDKIYWTEEFLRLERKSFNNSVSILKNSIGILQEILNCYHFGSGKQTKKYISSFFCQNSLRNLWADGLGYCYHKGSGKQTKIRIYLTAFPLLFVRDMYAGWILDIM